MNMFHASPRLAGRWHREPHSSSRVADDENGPISLLNLTLRRNASWTDWKKVTARMEFASMSF
jgi:hypothetical protein